MVKEKPGTSGRQKKKEKVGTDEELVLLGRWTGRDHETSPWYGKTNHRLTEYLEVVKR